MAPWTKAENSFESFDLIPWNPRVRVVIMISQEGDTIIAPQWSDSRLAASRRRPLSWQSHFNFRLWSSSPLLWWRRWRRPIESRDLSSSSFQTVRPSERATEETVISIPDQKKSLREGGRERPGTQLIHIPILQRIDLFPLKFKSISVDLQTEWSGHQIWIRLLVEISYMITKLRNIP